MNFVEVHLSNKTSGSDVQPNRKKLTRKIKDGGHFTVTTYVSAYIQDRQQYNSIGHIYVFVVTYPARL